MKPILVLQMQRMGDLILSFPLLSYLQNLYPNNPIWTVAEPHFFTELMQFAPKTTFFPPQAASGLQHHEFHSVINLSHRQDSAELAGLLRTEHYFGQHTNNTISYIEGAWSLYRASIVHNNRYNLFHWSDLQVLNHAKQGMRAYHQAKLHTENQQGKVGIFVGASEKEKRPSPQFFASLAQELMRKGYYPAFLGGPDDVALGNEAASLAGIKHASLCGRFSINALAKFMQELSLLISPDTGPMHLAAWLRTPILNISIGPVNPWETAPFFPNHYVLQPNISCSGCWQACAKTPCQTKLHPGRVALVAKTIMENPSYFEKIEFDDMCVFRTYRDERNLYDLLPINNSALNSRMLLARFWQDWFWHQLGQGTTPSETCLNELKANFPYISEKLSLSIIALSQELQKHLKSVFRGKRQDLEDSFWQKLPSPIRPFTGYLHLYLQNENYSQKAWDKVLQDVDALSNLLK